MSAITANTKLTEVVWDCYPHLESTPQQTLGWFPSAVFDAWTPAARGNTMWAVLQSFAKPGTWRYPTPEELRAVTYLSLAAGCKGVFYFLYQTMPKHAENLKGLIDPQGKPLPMYAPATVLAKELHMLSPLLLSLKPAESQFKIQGDARVGKFVDDQGREVLIVASLRPDMPIDVQLTGLTSKVFSPWRDALTDETFVPEEDTLKIPLRPGGGRVLVKTGWTQ